MHFFRYAQDYYGDWMAVQLLPDAARLLMWLVAVFVGVHLLRRALGPAVPSEPADSLIETGEVQKYSLGARLYHWGNFFFIAVLAVSGWALFVPRSLKAPLSSWVLIHEVSSGLFIAGLMLHIVAALARGERRSMWFGRDDWKDVRSIVSNFFGRTRSYPRFGKYDPFQKLYHAFLTLLSAAMIFSGVSLVLSAENWRSFDHQWLRWQRLLHDVGAFTFIAIILGHIYFGIIRVNWPELAAMFTGKISRSQFRLKHSPTKWKPNDEAEAERKS
ncbi:MAG TPA: cytochrome b/b6 domain-containing protein [Blastocatellia bacterium]|jgi:Ni/Fe-hydrogenase 1 B-type cytochrome subunit|nr:cytochrome b/b6 domain-containing protein [Blastocatellia bacterium]